MTIFGQSQEFKIISKELSSDQNDDQIIKVDKDTEIEIVTHENETNEEDVDQMLKMFKRFQIGDDDSNTINFVGFSEQTTTLN